MHDEDVRIKSDTPKRVRIKEGSEDEGDFEHYSRKSRDPSKPPASSLKAPGDRKIAAAAAAAAA